MVCFKKWRRPRHLSHLYNHASEILVVPKIGRKSLSILWFMSIQKITKRYDFIIGVQTFAIDLRDN